MNENEILALLNSKHYKENYTPKKENDILSIGGATIGTRGNFIVYSGLPKAGKTTFLAAAIASAISKKTIYQQTMNLSGGGIALFDTESNESDFYNNLNRIKNIASIKKFPANFSAFFTREFSSEITRVLIEFYISKQLPAVVIVDGFLDLINNYNNETESKIIIDWLKRISAQYNVLIIGVIHLGKRDGHTLGHFGSMIDRYAQSVLSVSRDDENRNIYTLSAKYLRSAAVWFEDINIEFTGLTYEEIYMNKPPPAAQKNKRQR